MAFRDKYTDFTFDDKKSSSYKVWITNKNDLQIALTPNFKDKFTSPQFGGVRYLDGTTIEKTDIKISCIAIDVTLNEWRAICNWLSPTKIGKLSFDFNKYTYYNVKLSNSVDAKMFNYSGKDSLLGGRKIIEFSLSFTTVGDYAAIGQINTATLGLERSSSATVTNKVNELITRSINQYRIPCILSDIDKVEEGDYISGLDLKLSSSDHKVIQWTADETTHELEFLTSKSKWNYKIIKTGTPTDVYYNGLHNYNYVSVIQPNSIMSSIENSDTGSIDYVNTDTTGYNIFNVGEYEAYPRIMLNGVVNNFEIWLDDVLYYRYDLINNRVLNNIVIDCQSGTVTYNGRFLDNATDAFGYNIVNGSHNIGPLAIPSGNAEIHNAKLESYSATNKKIKFILQEPMIHNYNNSINLGVTVSRNINSDVNYGEDLYGSPYYEPHVVGNYDIDNSLNNTSFYLADVHSTISEYDINDKRKVEIQLTPSVINAAWNETGWISQALSNTANKNQIFYVSFCEGHRLTIKINNSNVTSDCFISLQSRGAI